MRTFSKVLVGFLLLMAISCASMVHPSADQQMAAYLETARISGIAVQGELTSIALLNKAHLISEEDYMKAKLAQNAAGNAVKEASSAQDVVTIQAKLDIIKEQSQILLDIINKVKVP